MPGFVLILECVNKRICNMLMRHVFNKYVPKLVCLFSKYAYSLEHLPFVVANIFILFVIFSEHLPGVRVRELWLRRKLYSFVAF